MYVPDVNITHPEFPDRLSEVLLLHGGGGDIIIVDHEKFGKTNEIFYVTIPFGWTIGDNDLAVNVLAEKKSEQVHWLCFF